MNFEFNELNIMIQELTEDEREQLRSRLKQRVAELELSELLRKHLKRNENE